MAETIKQGFVIKKHNYADYDQVVTILTIDGKLSFLARGVRKMMSKNRYALQLGNLIEIEIFQARLNNKLSKLKKASAIKEFSSDNPAVRSSILRILNIINKIDYPHQYFYQTLFASIDYFVDYHLQITTYFKFLNLKQNGLSPVMNKCYQCLSYQNIIDFDWHRGGFMCHLHTTGTTSLEKLKTYQKLDQGVMSYLKVNHKINLVIDQEIDQYAQQTLY